jgi:enoyl-CoA hydratase/carnithine racemase
MNAAFAQLTVVEPTAGYWRVTFSNPPINLINPETIFELQELVSLIETDNEVRVVVFDSSHPDFFFGRYDLARAAEMPMKPGPTGLPTWTDMTTRLSRSNVVSIALIRGRNRGAGSEFSLACDMRFASAENAKFGQPEVAAGILPGGGAIERLPTLTGRGRALEIILGGDDFDALTAERYGWINRALPDAELDGFVDQLARRIASFDSQALSEAKRLVNRNALPAAQDLFESQTIMLQAITWPSTRARGAKLRERALAVGMDFEMRMGHHLGNLNSS